jgi:predicted lipase
MYFPDNFDLKKARELVNLVDQAYIQFKASEVKDTWELQGNYDFITEIDFKGLQEEFFTETRAFFEREFKNLIKSPKSIYTGVHTGLPLGFIARKYNDVYIIFRGTMTSMEWLRNLDFDLKPYPLDNFGRVHEGFLHIFTSLKDTIDKTLSGMPKFKKLNIAGHSLGGAVATLLIPWLNNKFPKNPITIYTFGSPRVGDSEFVSEYNRLFAKKTFRIANSSDLVVSVPFPAKFMGYFGGPFTHVDTPVDFTSQNGGLEQNHKVSVYSDAVYGAKQRFSFRRYFSRIF